MTVSWPFLFLMARGVALISTIRSSIGGILTDPASAGLRTGRFASGTSLSLTRLGRRTFRVARCAQVSENSCNCTDSFALSFVPHRRVISRDSDLHALGVSISSTSDLACVSCFPCVWSVVCILFTLWSCTCLSVWSTVQGLCGGCTSISCWFWG